MPRYNAYRYGYRISHSVLSLTMLIDTITAKNLELVYNTIHTHTKRNTLLGVVDYTLTPMGKRLLRTNILQPPCNANIINNRLNAIEELCKNEECIYNIQSCLKQLVDIDCVISFIAKIPNASAKNSVLAVQYSEQKINHVVHLKQTVKSIKTIAKSLPDHIKNSSSQLNQQDHPCILLYTAYNVSYFNLYYIYYINIICYRFYQMRYLV